MRVVLDVFSEGLVEAAERVDCTVQLLLHDLGYHLQLLFQVWLAVLVGFVGFGWSICFFRGDRWGGGLRVTIAECKFTRVEVSEHLLKDALPKVDPDELGLRPLLQHQLRPYLTHDLLAKLL